MKSLMVFENQLNEYTDKWHPLGYALIDYLPINWQHIESGVQEHGVNIKFEMSPDLEKLSNEELMAHTLNKLCERTSDGKFRIKGGGRFVNLREVAFQNLLCDFYTVCNENRHYYTETNFIRVMETNGFHIPKFTYRAFDTFTKTEVSTVCIIPQNLYNVRDLLDDIKNSPYFFARNYQCENDEEYFLAIALELVRQRHLVKQCEHCGRWFVTEKKTDEKYCKRESPTHTGKTCQQAMRLIKDNQRINSDPLKKAKAAARNRAHSQENHKHIGAVAQCKDLIKAWDKEYKSGALSEADYILRLNNAFIIRRKT